MKINLPNRQRLLVIGAGIMVALFVLNSILIEPLISTYQDHAKEIAKLKADVARGSNAINRAKTTEKTWDDMKANALPRDPAEAEQNVISAFDRWGRANNIELSSIRPQWKRGAKDTYSLLECRVDATGNISTLSRFIYEVEHSSLALRIDSVEMSARDDFGQKLTLGLIVSGLRLSPLERKQQ